MKFFDTNIGDAVASEMYNLLQKKAGITKNASKECKCDVECDCKKNGTCKCEIACPDMCSCSKAKEAHVKNIAKKLLRFADKLEESNLEKSAANLLTLANLLMVEAQEVSFDWNGTMLYPGDKIKISSMDGDYPIQLDVTVDSQITQGINYEDLVPVIDPNGEHYNIDKTQILSVVNKAQSKTATAASPMEETLLDVEEEPETLRMPEKMPDVLVSKDMLDEKALELDSLEKKLESLDEMEAEPMSSKKTEEEKFEEIMRDWAKINKDEK